MLSNYVGENVHLALHGGVRSTPQHLTFPSEILQFVVISGRLLHVDSKMCIIKCIHCHKLCCEFLPVYVTNILSKKDYYYYYYYTIYTIILPGFR